MFWSIQIFAVNSRFTEGYHIFCAWMDLLTIFICSRYRPWATIRLLHHFGFVMCINYRLYCTHFSCHWRKIGNVSRQLTQISERQLDPWCNFTKHKKTPSADAPPPPPPPPTHTQSGWQDNPGQTHTEWVTGWPWTGVAVSTHTHTHWVGDRMAQDRGCSKHTHTHTLSGWQDSPGQGLQ